MGPALISLNDTMLSSEQLTLLLEPLKKQISPAEANQRGFYDSL